MKTRLITDSKPKKYMPQPGDFFIRNDTEVGEPHLCIGTKQKTDDLHYVLLSTNCVSWIHYSHLNDITFTKLKLLGVDDDGTLVFEKA